MDADRLAKRSKEGDKAAFGQIYEQYARRIYAYCYYRTLNRETAEDLTSTVFVSALEGLSGFRPELGGFSAWIYGIARNALRDHFRRVLRVQRIDELPGCLWDIPGDEDIALDAENRDLWERLKPYLAALSEEQREIIILRLWDGLSYREIAGSLGKTEGSCKMAYSRALALLRGAMPLSLFIAFLAAKPPIA